MIEIALSCVRRGWYVFPCKPGDKEPLVKGGFKAASNDENKIHAWWTRWPEANVAISGGPSNLCVLDMDEGPVQSGADLEAWIITAGLPRTFTVRTGRRISKKDGSPEFGVHLYFQDAIPDVGLWKLAGGSGQVKSLGGYVMAAGSIHPDSKERYEVLWDEPIVTTPDAVRALSFKREISLAPADGKLSVLLAGLAAVGWPHEMSSDGTKIHVECPFGDHKPGSVSSTTLFIKNGWYCFVCKHGHCLGVRSYRHFKEEVEKRCKTKK